MKMKHKMVVGVDPGKTGGIAILDNWGKLIICAAMPVVTVGGKSIVDANAMDNILYTHVIDVGYVENVHAMPKQGGTSMFNFGRSYGAVEYGLETGTLDPLQRVTPQKWKKYFGLSADKDEAIAKATEVFGSDEHWNETGPRGGFKPENSGRAEAALIAKYGWEKENHAD